MLQGFLLGFSILLCWTCFDVACFTDSSTYIPPLQVEMYGANISEEELFAAEKYLLSEKAA